MIPSLTPVVLVMNDEYFLPYALECTRGHFERYVIYDVGSTDETGNVIDWFVETNKEAKFVVRKLPFVDPAVQGTFRNSMIPETETNFYFILDADEVYHESEFDRIYWAVCGLENKHYDTKGKVKYGAFKRIEVSYDLTMRYDKKRSHHRLYHRSAYWTGSHPGEDPVFTQNKNSEAHFDDITCYHFHNAARSTADVEVPKRQERKTQHTYHPGELIPFKLLDELPILRRRINGFRVNPELERLQHEYNME